MLILTLMAAAACTRVKTEEYRATPLQAKAVCSVDWSGVSGPSSTPFTVAATRTMKAEHHFWEDVMPVSTGHPDTLSMGPGEYQTIFFVSGDMKAYKVENIDSFEENTEQSLREVTARLRSMPKDTLAKYFGGFEPMLVSYFDTIPPAPDLYQASARANLVAGETTTIGFKPVQLVQNLTFRIRIQVEGELEIHRVVGCVTGLPDRVELLSGYYGVERMGQALFDMTKQSDGWWQGSLKTLGVKASSDATLKVGPGIFKVCAEVGPKHRRIATPINIISYLEKQPSLIFTDVEGFYKGEAHSATYQIEETMTLKGSDTELSDDPAVIIWIEHGDGETGDIIDGDDTDGP